MISPELVAKIRHLFHAEHWKMGTIAAELGLHRETVRRALQSDRFNRYKVQRPKVTDPYLEFIRDTLGKYPRLRATRIYEMIRARGYTGSVVQLRRVVAALRPLQTEAFLRLRTFPGEQGQVDWAHFGQVRIGRAQRRLSCFVLTLSYSRALFLEFFFDQTLENLLRGHVHAFQDLGGCPRTLLYDNMKSVVIERRGDAIHFHPRMLELSAHYHFAARPCRPARGNEKGRVERAIQYIRHSFFAARPFTTLEDFNRQARLWRDQIAHGRPWPGDGSRTVQQVFQEEKKHLLPLPAHPFDTDLVLPIGSRKTIYVRFDLNDYSIPPAAVGRSATLVASDRWVRILDGSVEIARHRRCYDRGQVMADPDHQKALLEEKRKALGATPSGRLSQAVPESEAFLDAAFQRGESVARQTVQLLRLLDEYGVEELRTALGEALQRNTPRASSVAFLLKKRRRLLEQPSPLPVDLSRRPELAELHIQPHHPETYDELSEPDES
ncbi:MAG: IS21 family transposase [Terriglobia bacterium]